jgi:hypothetical protein
MLLVGGKTLPIILVGAEIDLLGGPENLLMLLVGIPYLRILDRIEAIALIILAEDVLDGDDWIYLVGHFLYFPLFLKNFSQNF